MRFFASLALLLLPVGASAAVSTAEPSSSFFAEKSVLVATSTPGSVYAAGATVAITAPTKGDLSAVGGSVIITGAVAGDALLSGGSVSLRAAVAEDVRVVAGSASVESPTTGDLVIFAPSISVTESAGSNVLLVGANVTLSGGAKGPVTIYANNVALGGSFESDVRVIAGGRVSLASDTKIAGSLSYESPEQARIPAETPILGGVHYKGPSYLPSSEQAHALALAGFGVFLFIRFLAAIILAGLIAGLFPRFTHALTYDAFETSARHRLLALLLGFAVIVASPILIFFLALTFVGIGIALFASAVYILLSLLAFISAGILIGNFLARHVWKREEVRWHDGVIGMLIFSCIALIPGIGMLLDALLIAFAEGTLAVLLFHFAFPKDSDSTLVE